MVKLTRCYFCSRDCTVFTCMLFFNIHTKSYQFSSVQSLSHVRLFATPWTAARQASLSITNSQSLPKPMSVELVMPANHLILCRPLLLLPSIFPSIRVFSNESALHIRSFMVPILQMRKLRLKEVKDTWKVAGPEFKLISLVSDLAQTPEQAECPIDTEKIQDS